MERAAENRIRVAVLDDHLLSRQAVVCALQAHARLAVCLAAPLSVRAELAAAAPHAAVVNLTGGDVVGLDCIRHVRQHLPQAHVLSYAFAPLTDAVVRLAVDLGAHAHVDPTSELTQLAETIVDMRRAGARSALPRPSSKADAAGNVARHVRGLLSKREQAVLACLGEGLCQRSAARHLGIDPRTVATHCSRIRTKLRLDGIDDLERLAVRLRVSESLTSKEMSD